MKTPGSELPPASGGRVDLSVSALSRHPLRPSKDTLNSASKAGIVPANELISPLFEAFSRRLAESDGTLSFYLHRPAGPVAIRGGDYGPQTIQTLAMDDSLVAFMQQSLTALDPMLAVDFTFVDQPEAADIRLYLDSTIELGDGGNTLGIALINEDSQRPFWELIFNTPALASNPLYMRYAMLHETGHALGMEHPFDQSDGDVYKSQDSSRSASADQTLMAYAEPRNGIWPTAYTSSDHSALQAIWGQEETSSSNQLIGGDGPDMITGGDLNDDIFGYGGADQLKGGLGSNSFTSPSDGARDWLYVTRDGSKLLSQAAATVDVITAIGREDRIAILDANRRKLRFRSLKLETPSHGLLSGIGIYSGGALEAMYTGNDLSLAEIRRITTGVPSASLG
jgi:serralysin